MTRLSCVTSPVRPTRAKLSRRAVPLRPDAVPLPHLAALLRRGTTTLRFIATPLSRQTMPVRRLAVSLSRTATPLRRLAIPPIPLKNRSFKPLSRFWQGVPAERTARLRRPLQTTQTNKKKGKWYGRSNPQVKPVRPSGGHRRAQRVEKHPRLQARQRRLHAGQGAGGLWLARATRQHA